MIFHSPKIQGLWITGAELNPEVKSAHLAKFCNCDNNDSQWRVDEGYLTDKNTLPVIGLEFNKKSAKSDFTLGPLECWGTIREKRIPKKIDPWNATRAGSEEGRLFSQAREASET